MAGTTFTWKVAGKMAGTILGDEDIWQERRWREKWAGIAQFGRPSNNLCGRSRKELIGYTETDQACSALPWPTRAARLGRSPPGLPGLAARRPTTWSV